MLDVFRAASWVVKLTAAGEEANRPHGLNSTLTVGKIWCFPPRYVWRKTFVFSTVLTVDQRSDAICTLTINRLRVFRRAKVAYLCSGVGPKRETSAVPSEKCVARWGSEYDEMRVITTSFARVLERCTGHLYIHFS